MAFFTFQRPERSESDFKCLDEPNEKVALEKKK